MYKYYFTILFVGLLLIHPKQTFAQNVQKEIDAINVIALQMHEDTTLQGRLRADSLFTKSLIQILKQPHSYAFDFSNMTAIKVIESPDHLFKIFTWHVELADGTYRQKGAFQFKTENGQLNLLPLFDQSDFTLTPERGIYDAKHWIGAVYYDMIRTEFNGQILYTLLGYDEYTKGITRKIMEVLHFENNTPIFGGDYFAFPKDPTFPLAPINRWVMSFKKGSNAAIRYIKASNTIEITELTSTTNDWKDPSTWVPSGLQYHFQFTNGKWTMRPEKY